MALAKDVLERIDHASSIVGKYEDDTWNQRLWVECQELKMESPIEQVLYCAVLTVARVNWIEEADNPFQEKDVWHAPGLAIIPQRKIGNYRVDFAVSHERKNPRTGAWEDNTVIVECDSQQFHERTERERRYEKQRDRFLQAQGYHTMHFTGAEIMRTPYGVAAEILEAVCTDRPSKEELLGNIENFS